MEFRKTVKSGLVPTERKTTKKERDGITYHLPENWYEYLTEGVGREVIEQEIPLFGWLRSQGDSHPARTIKILMRSQGFVEWYDKDKQQKAVAKKLRSRELRNKIEETNLRKYGARYALQTEEGKKKLISTNQKRYGHNSPKGNPLVKYKAEQTSLRKYGVKNYGGTKEARIKAVATNIEKYGTENPQALPEIDSKRVATNMARYGVASTSQVKEIRDRQIQTSVDRYGVPYPLQNKEIFDKAKKTNLERRGVEFPNMLTEEGMIERLRKYFVEPIGEIPKYARGGKEYKEYLGKCLHCGREFNYHFSGNRHYPTSCPSCSHRSTILERNIIKFIRKLGFEVIDHDFEILKGEFQGRPEIDIVIPSLKIGIEVNGAFSHNSGVGVRGGEPKPTQFHKKKSDIALRKGYSLYHIWEHWDHSLIRSMLRAKLNRPLYRIYARDLKVVIDKDNSRVEEVEAFLEENHLHGSSIGTFSVILEDSDGSIVQVMVLKSTKDRKVFENIRNASLKNAQVVGGFARLLKHAESHLKSVYPEVDTILNFAYRDFTPDPENSVYFRHGFKLDGTTAPALWYWCQYSVKDKEGNVLVRSGSVINRQLFMKNKLSKRFRDVPGWEFRENETEHENLARLSIYPIYDSGNWRFVKKIK